MNNPDFSLSQPSSTPASILLVDDEKNVLRSLQRLFLEENYQLFLAENAQEGLTILEKNVVHLVISDYRMPGMDGVAFLKEVRQRYPQIVRIVISGYADTKSIVSAINDGEIYKFIPKPWNDEHLKLMVNSALEHYRLFEENRQLTGTVRKQNRELRRLNEELEQTVIRRTGDLLIQDRMLSLSQQLIECLPVSIIAIDSHGIVTLANEMARHLIGDSLIKKKEEDFLPPSLVQVCQDVRENKIDQKNFRGELFGEKFKGKIMVSGLSTIDPLDSVMLVLLSEGEKDFEKL